MDEQRAYIDQKGVFDQRIGTTQMVEVNQLELGNETTRRQYNDVGIKKDGDENPRYYSGV
jgi:hypothetical protein